MIVLLAALFVGFAPPNPSVAPTDAPALADTLDAVTKRTRPVEVSPVFPLGALYSGTYGVGLGAGVRVENVGWEGSSARATAFGSIYGYGADVVLATGDPYARPVYGLLHAEASRATRRRYFGVGPGSVREDRVDLDHRSASVDARVGVYPFKTTALLVQPSARLRIDRLDAPTPETDAGLGQLSGGSQAAARALVGETRVGVSLGVEIASDRLDWHDYPSSGTYASLEARRFRSVDGTELAFSSGTAQVSAYLPLGRRTVLMGHAAGAVTRPAGGALLPFPYLATLDNDLLLAYQTDRFRGRDALALALGLRVPITQFYGVVGIDADVTGTLGNVYNDVVRQLDPSVTFDTTVDTEGGIPFRPAASVGLHVVNLDARSVYIGGRVGVSPEGAAVALVALRADIRDLVPIFR